MNTPSPFSSARKALAAIAAYLGLALVQSAAAQGSAEVLCEKYQGCADGVAATGERCARDGQQNDG